MKLLLFTIALLFSVTSFAQSGINYKALIKDGSGTIVANQNITVQFSILKGVAQANVYQETQTPTTDANGLVIVNIGEGTTNDDFSTIDWGSDDHFLNVQINSGAGFTDMGTTQFMAVPYALHAANVAGLEAIDEGNGIGYRLKGTNPANYNNIGENAVDLSINPNASEVFGASGNYATAMGANTTASGSFSTALNSATTASGAYATAMGFSTKASSLGATSIGVFNVGNGSATSWVPTDPIFEVGNGTSDNGRLNALTVLKNGKVGIGSNQPVGFLEVKATNSTGQPNLNLIHEGIHGARINFSNTDTTNGNLWTLYGDTNDVDANSYFNIFHTNTGNIVTLRGDGKVTVNGDLAVTSTTKIGASGVAISEIVKLTGVTYRNAVGNVGSNNIPYPPGYNWENTYVVSFKVKQRVAGLGGINKYTSLGNYNSGDDQSVYVDLRYDPTTNNTNYIQLKISDPQYEGAEYVLILMKID